MDFFYVFFKIHTKSGAQIGDFRTGGCHPLLKIDGWHATRATRSNEGPEFAPIKKERKISFYVHRKHPTIEK